MNVLFTCQKGSTVLFKGWESRGLHYSEWRSQGPWILRQPPCQAAVNKASAELKNGNEFLIGDTLYLSSWQQSDCTVAFSFFLVFFFVLVRSWVPSMGPCMIPPLICWGLSRVKEEDKKTKHNNRALAWMITLNYSLGYLKSWINHPTTPHPRSSWSSLQKPSFVARSNHASLRLSIKSSSFQAFSSILTEVLLSAREKNC